MPQLGVINFDKAIHLIMFGGLTLLFAKGFYKQPTYELLNRHYLTAAFIFCTLYGGFLEILQATDWINRSGDWLDFLFNALGALAAIGILKLQKDLLLR
ncbi:MAG: VanZ family protein [Methylovulum sp.]